MAESEMVTLKERSKQIDRYLKDERKKYNDYVKNTMKLLLVGAGESGKSTIVKQMKLLHQGGYDNRERQEFIPIIRGNLRDAILTITGNMQTLQPSIHLCDPTLKPCLDYMQDYASLPDFQYTEEFYDKAKMLWEDEGVQECYGRANEYQLIDSAEYFLDRIDEIREEDYVPSNQDILRSRKITTGVLQTSFEVNNVHFQMLDVGGQRDERKKWIQCFSDVTALIFVVACSSFDLVLREDQNKNRLQESLELYERLWKNRFLRSTSVILFLNKQDILAQKVSKGTSLLSHYYADYEHFEPPETIEPPEGWCCFSTKRKRAEQRRRESMFPALNISESKEFFKAKSFIKAKFQDLSVCDEKEHHFIKHCYSHFTIAVNSENISIVFDSCKDMIQRLHLTKAGIIR
ncbi:guanine nucleotide-binding protein G(s) subunit alpha-like isoform X1 [Patiria miniata]|uniref:Guanine nucleotide-binding protein G(s) subunit alpha n=2 Tax=Patiria miniata TaxID=46514 RepID=A0A914ACQ0_PATMI|nr:guanine nucleotide-binding protein G(s) subunit alpha-like isoform X1 [Patiria miniata]